MPKLVSGVASSTRASASGENVTVVGCAGPPAKIVIASVALAPDVSVTRSLTV